MKNTIRFLAVLFAAISLSVLLCQFFEWPVKTNLSKDDYLVEQKLFNSLSWVYFIEFLALLHTLILVLLERKKKRTFILLLIALVAFAISIVIFFIFTLPTDIATSSWSMLPDNWESLRDQWEDSVVWRALINLTGFSFLVLAMLRNRYYYRQDFV